MDEFITLCALSLAMFLGCYLAGLIPLTLSLSEKLLRNVTVFGAGLLIGTALIVIIPEGIESLYEAVPLPATKNNQIQSQDIVGVVPELGLPSNSPGGQEGDGKGPEPHEGVELYIGLSLVIGFVFMLVIDQLSPAHTHQESDAENGGGVARKRGGMTATIGLVVHAAADGLALGAAAGLSKTNVEFIIFIAIMLHKAPAAFGFTTFLLHEGFDKRTAKYHLLVFALAAPLSSFVAYFGLVRVPLTGIAMLFSAGTFLYVATVHVLNEVTNGSSDHNKLSRLEVIVIVAGALLPLLFNFTHSH